MHHHPNSAKYSPSPSSQYLGCRYAHLPSKRAAIVPVNRLFLAILVTLTLYRKTLESKTFVYRFPKIKDVLLDNPEFDYDSSMGGSVGGFHSMTNGFIKIFKDDVLYVENQGMLNNKNYLEQLI